MNIKWALKNQKGFTLVELLIVIVVIAILAAISVVAYNGIQSRAQTSRVQADLSALERAVMLARTAQSQTMLQIDGSSYTAGNCKSKPAGTDLAALPATDPCWVSYNNALSRIASASGANVTGMVDPWGRPYFIDENEGEGGLCGKDTIAVYKYPFDGGTGTAIQIPLSGLTGC